jgi:hypothetical protein
LHSESQAYDVYVELPALFSDWESPHIPESRRTARVRDQRKGPSNQANGEGNAFHRPRPALTFCPLASSNEMSVLNMILLRGTFFVWAAGVERSMKRFLVLYISDLTEGARDSYVATGTPEVGRTSHDKLSGSRSVTPVKRGAGTRNDD